MATTEHYLVEAALRACDEAEEIVRSGDLAAADALKASMREAEESLHFAGAYMRQRFAPLSVSGFGEQHDQLKETVDRMVLDADAVTGSRARREAGRRDHRRARFTVVDDA
jgi:hypothetical protein